MLPCLQAIGGEDGGREECTGPEEASQLIPADLTGL